MKTFLNKPTSSKGKQQSVEALQTFFNPTGTYRNEGYSLMTVGNPRGLERHIREAAARGTPTSRQIVVEKNPKTSEGLLVRQYGLNYRGVVLESTTMLQAMKEAAASGITLNDIDFDVLTFDSDEEATCRFAAEQGIPHFSMTFSPRGARGIESIAREYGIAKRPAKGGYCRQHDIEVYPTEQVLLTFFKDIFRGYDVMVYPYRGVGHTPMLTIAARKLS